jgi:hypothetical protein
MCSCETTQNLLSVPWDSVPDCSHASCRFWLSTLALTKLLGHTTWTLSWLSYLIWPWLIWHKLEFLTENLLYSAEFWWKYLCHAHLSCLPNSNRKFVACCRWLTLFLCVMSWLYCLRIKCHMFFGLYTLHCPMFIHFIRSCCFIVLDHWSKQEYSYFNIFHFRTLKELKESLAGRIPKQNIFFWIGGSSS